jgi:KipI family sensor histidine kinase inhibitor
LNGASQRSLPRPTILPLGDSAMLVRFGDRLTDDANRAAIALARQLGGRHLAGVLEVVPGLVSVMVRYDPVVSEPQALAGELRLIVSVLEAFDASSGAEWTIPVRFDGADLDEVAGLVGLGRDRFVAAHNARPLRVLATGFAPGFVYCGLHDDALIVPRREQVRSVVAAGSVLFAAGQTAIAATAMPTGWHVIGHTGFANFDPAAEPPTRLAAGDMLRFVVDQ